MNPIADPVALRTVQSCIGPTIGLCTEALLYFRCNDFVIYEHERQAWRIARGGNVWFNTYFNGLSIKRWKGTAALQDLQVEIAFEGRLTVRLHRMQVGPVASVVDEIELASSHSTVRRWSLRDWDAFDDGIVFLSMYAHDDSTLHGFAFKTSTPVVRPVRLGLVITHFDRKEQIVPAIARLTRQLLDDPEFADRVGLVVVDNSRSLDAGETPGATLLPNRNLGGAGGFARGMMHLNDDGSYTHALFMDDDASCEVEAIRRTITLLESARDAHTAISGAMLRKLEPHRQFERGAHFEGFCRPLRSGVDLRDPAVLAWNEREQSSDYGGWWFFAFPLATAIGYPFPYFVRGDDVDFSLRNDFAIVHANGVASWQEDFAFKHGPQTQYLDTRSHLLHILHGYGGGRLLVSIVALKLFLMPNLAGQYELARAALFAIDDVRRGPEFFRGQVDLAEPRARLRALIDAERMRPMDPAAMRHADFTGRDESRWRGRWRLATANGHLIPRLFFRGRAARFDKGYVLPLRGTFRRKRLFVHDEFSGTGMVLEHSKRRFFDNLARFAVSLAALVVGFDRLSRRYRDAYPSLTSDAFWREQFASSVLPSMTVGDPPQADHAAAPVRPATTAPLSHAA